jgi:EAL domain-containing protein (putative c-di-GMP-specific phosphodiesterase class I)
MCLGNEQHDSITEAIVAMGQSLNLETVAEGVETENQLSVVSDLCISVVQGYYYSKPVSAEEVRPAVQAAKNSTNLAFPYS